MPISWIPRPILVFHGAQGSGKSAVSRFIRNVLDPSSACLLGLHSKHDELLRELDHHAIFPADNVSGMARGTSDILCKACTGTAISTRQLYTDDQDFIRCFKRPIIVNGIPIASSAPDFLDRSILIEYDRIPDSERKPEQDLDKLFNQAAPKILGGILDMLVKVLATVDQMQITELPRMADFAKYGAAAAEVIGFGAAGFLEAMRRNTVSQHEEVIESDIVCTVLNTFLENDGEFKGTATQLFEKLFAIAEPLRLHKSQTWPKDPARLSKALKRVEHNLRETGIIVERSKSVGRGLRIYRETVDSNRSFTVLPTVSDKPAPVQVTDSRDGKDGKIPTMSISEMDSEQQFDCRGCVAYRREFPNHPGVCRYVDKGEGIQVETLKACPKVSGNDNQLQNEIPF